MAKCHRFVHLLALFALALSLTIGENPVGARPTFGGNLARRAGCLSQNCLTFLTSRACEARIAITAESRIAAASRTAKA
ncbi:hypothetical protein NL676_039142 [Syzygium grande]|nr:hypothetical protein NL676_039142 [Syzygium grande]